MTSQLGNKRRVDALFRALSSDYLLREQFVTDPAQILTEYVSGERLDPNAAAAANHLVYAVVSSPGLLKWVQSAGTKGEVPAGEAFADQFSAAVGVAARLTPEVLARIESALAAPPSLR